MTAHLCAHPGVCSAPPNWGARQKSVGGGTEKNFFRRFAPAFVPPHFQFASGASAYEAIIGEQEIVGGIVSYYFEYNIRIELLKRYNT